VSERYLARSKAAAVDTLNRVEQLSFDDLYATALQYPLVWEADLRDWLLAWSKGKYIELQGLKPRQRVPKHSQHIRVRRLKHIGD
jgi:hypothetical protein